MFIKSEDDIKKCIQILKDQFEMIKIYQIELIVGSVQYPQASWERIWTMLEWIHSITPEMTKEEKLLQAQVEL
jgi:hypothetical protein